MSISQTRVMFVSWCINPPGWNPRCLFRIHQLLWSFKHEFLWFHSQRQPYLLSLQISNGRDTHHFFVFQCFSHLCILCLVFSPFYLYILQAYLNFLFLFFFFSYLNFHAMTLGDLCRLVLCNAFRVFCKVTGSFYGFFFFRVNPKNNMRIISSDLSTFLLWFLRVDKITSENAPAKEINNFPNHRVLIKPEAQNNQKNKENE